MSTQVKITLHDELYSRAKHLAKLATQDVEDLLALAIELSLSPVGVSVGNYEPVAKLPDEEVLALTNLQMSPNQDKRLSKLLDKQQAGKLAKAEQSELLSLIQVYQEKLLRKAQALREAVRRGLRKPLSS